MSPSKYFISSELRTNLTKRITAARHKHNVKNHPKFVIIYFASTILIKTTSKTSAIFNSLRFCPGRGCNFDPTAHLTKDAGSLFMALPFALMQRALVYPYKCK